MENDATQKATDPKVVFCSPYESALSSLEIIATASLEAGKMSMEAGANAIGVETITQIFALGLGARLVELRIGYASLAITVGIDGASITCVRKVGDFRVNHRLIHALGNLGTRVAKGQLTAERTRSELGLLRGETPKYSAWITALAVGIACAAFGRLLGVDWRGVGPIALAAIIGQYVRQLLLRCHVNAFLCAAITSFISCVVAGLGARWAGSATITVAMISSILMLVPGVPAVNALRDILEGHPTLGNARAVTVVATLIFITAGLWLGNAAINEWHP